MKLHFLAAVLTTALATGAHASALTSCADANGFAELKHSLCAEVSVPLRPGGSETVALFVRKFPASGQARGTLWLISGGPGESGATFYPFVDTLRTAFPGFDLMVPDHRGTGYSTRLCPAEEAAGSPGGRALEGAEWGTCWASLNASPERTRAFSITNAAHDLAALIGRFGGSKPVYVYAVSYGTQLVLRTFQVAHPNVDGVILDSLVPPETSAVWDLSHRSQIVDGAGRKVLGAGTAAYEKLLAAPAPEQVPGKDLKLFFGTLLDFPSLRAQMPELIAELGRGETGTLSRVKEGLERIGRTLDRYPQAPPSIPLASLISVSENDARPTMTKADVAKEEGGFLFTAALPRLLVDPGLPLYGKDAYFGGVPAGLPRILVLQGTLDPKTPLAGAQSHVAQLGGRAALVPVADAPHFILMSAPDCFVEAVLSFRAGGKPRAPKCDARRFRSGF